MAVGKRRYAMNEAVAEFNRNGKKFAGGFWEEMLNHFICMCALVSLSVDDNLCVNIMISRKNFSGKISMKALIMAKR